MLMFLFLELFFYNLCCCGRGIFRVYGYVRLLLMWISKFLGSHCGGLEFFIVPFRLEILFCYYMFSEICFVVVDCVLCVGFTVAARYLY